ncbi:RagB/SusD family nutrient uptake outer membrane protein [Chitinophaga niabensis]|uniref:Starch-binding associating with outer membrane n=1 Tax=Chitinophaga niabensis TaxID=536979 RepID=A0A1N6G973_9BACT|nr:RagB/SusD family nutrient uptake outer membrane protein [Chitinophaga niabensis]SIO04100.1 Starch-binding associating with outer membrane [Chitinophaga niabensis]
MKRIKILALAALLGMVAGCNKYLDIVPDNIATIDYAFAMRSTAERYLFTCYNYMPATGDFNTNVAFMGADEIWFMYPSKDIDATNWNMARGGQNKVNPISNYWSGLATGKPLYQGIRDCNVFLEKISLVKDIDDDERARWIAEVKFLKAYYHFFLLRMYGPIPLVRRNIDVMNELEEMKTPREHFDTCVNYISRLLDTAAVDLPMRIQNEVGELGRVTRPIALALKAKLLVMAASPLFNGNPDYADFGKGTKIFPNTYDPDKWVKAAAACKQAIDVCHETGMRLYRFRPVINTLVMNSQIRTQMDIRMAVTDKWNSEIIWANTQSRVNQLQRFAMPKLYNWTSVSGNPKGMYAATEKMAELFYTKNGVPIDEDNQFNYAERYSVRKAAPEDSALIKKGTESAYLHFDREQRFYANLGFDRGVWFGNGSSDDNNTNISTAMYIQARKSQMAAQAGHTNYSITGYWPKKLIHYLSVVEKSGNFTMQQYPYPEMRLADLYLLYAEAENEANGPTNQAFEYIDSVRARAGLKGVKESWDTYSNKGPKYASKEGLRKIIQQERMIELAFEGHRFWDLRRWKIAHVEMNKPITGWDIDQEQPEAYYRLKVLFMQTFTMREYLWPIQEREILNNRNLVQNPGW